MNQFVLLKKNNMGIKEVLTPEQKKAARFAKALGHPIRMYNLELLSKQNCFYIYDKNVVSTNS
jgi:hypothetical protein